MSNVEAMIRAVDTIEANLKSDIAVAGIAAAVSYSLFHFCRVFNRVIQYTPYDYLMRRRLSEAAHELLETDKRIIDVALEYRFNNPETFSRAFKRLFGIQPYQWRERKEGSDWRLLPRLSPEYIERIQALAIARPAIVERPQATLTGWMALADGGLLWESFERELRRRAPELRPGAFYGVCACRRRTDARSPMYFAGVEASDLGDGFWVQKKLSPARYLCFTCLGRWADLPWLRQYIYHCWMAKQEKVWSEAFELEIFPGWPFSQGDQASELHILIPLL